MTADNFTDAARAEAERRYNRIVRRNKTADEWLDEGRASGFTSGAEWARTHLAAQEPTDAEVEAAEVEWEHHQPYKRFRMWWCRCGAPEKWGSLEAHRQHALRHILRATRRDEEKQ